MQITAWYVILSNTFLLTYSKWVIVWEDNFNGHAMNTSSWWYNSGCWKGNEELQCYTNGQRENVRVNNGILTIEARLEAWDEGRNFTSGRIMSAQSWKYGRFEARAKLPKGKNLWPAIWLLPAKSRDNNDWINNGELDIMEYDGIRPSRYSGSIHYANKLHKTSGLHNFSPIDFSQDYHVFSVEWNRQQIKWYMDNVNFYTESVDRSLWDNKEEEGFDTPYFWILNLAVGGIFFDKPYVTPDEAKLWEKSTFEIDYVRVYQWK